MPRSKHVRSEEGDLFVSAPDGTDIRLAGVLRMHFYRLAGATPEEATDEQVERYLALRAQEEASGQRATPARKAESAADMVARELRILNLPQVLEAGNGETEVQATPGAPETSVSAPPSGRRGGLGEAPRYRPAQGLPPVPRYAPQAAGGPASAPKSRFLRREGAALHLQAPDGTEQRVTQYMRVHFSRMLEKDITEATDQEIETWWKLQGALAPGATLPEAQSQNLLTEALKAAGKLKRTELEVLHQAISAWLEARGEGGGG